VVLGSVLLLDVHNEMAKFVEHGEDVLVSGFSSVDQDAPLPHEQSSMHVAG
jgi:hypothetical protein